LKPPMSINDYTFTSYGWKLIDIEEIENKYIFEVDCVFKGKTEFPNYLEEKEEE